MTGEAGKQEDGVEERLLEEIENLRRRVEAAEAEIGRLSAELNRLRTESDEEMYRRLIATSLDSMMLIEPDGRLLAANRSAALMHGFESLAEMLNSGINATDLIAPENRQSAVEEASLLGKGESGNNAEFTLLKKDGTPFAAEVGILALVGEGESPTRLMIMGRDITERKRIEAALRDSEKRFRSLVAAAPDAIVLTDAQGIILEMNDAYLRLFGYEREEMLGKSYLGFISIPEIREKARQALLFLQRGGNPPLREIPVAGKTGKVILVEQAMAILRDEDGRLTNFICILRDISERKKLEEMRQNVIAAESVRQTVVTLAHYINNYLLTLNISLESALKQKAHPPETLDVLRNSHSNVGKIAAVIRVLQRITDVQRTIYHGQTSMIDIEAALNEELERGPAAPHVDHTHQPEG